MELDELFEDGKKSFRMDHISARDAPDTGYLAGRINRLFYIRPDTGFEVREKKIFNTFGAFCQFPIFLDI
jgi:hypothetical protein